MARKQTSPAGHVHAVFATDQVFEQDFQAEWQSRQVESLGLQCRQSIVSVGTAAGDKVFRLEKVFMDECLLAVFSRISDQEMSASVYPGTGNLPVPGMIIVRTLRF